MAQKTDKKEQAHNLIERLGPRQLSAVVGMLEAMTDPVSRAIANAPADDEPQSDAEREAVERSKRWFTQNPAGIAHEDVLSEFNVNPEELKER